MKFSDTLANPIKVGLAPAQIFNTKPQPGGQKMPWLQASSRNVARSLFGDTVASGVEQKILGDVPAGATLGGGTGPAVGQQFMMQSQNPMLSWMQLLQKGGM